VLFFDGKVKEESKNDSFLLNIKIGSINNKRLILFKLILICWEEACDGVLLFYERAVCGCGNGRQQITRMRRVADEVSVMEGV
jgi:hypothetical protein